MVVAVLEGGWRIATMMDLLRNLRGARFHVRVVSVTEALSAKREVLAALKLARDEIAAGLVAIRTVAAS
jgi:hypothetical protein